MRWFIGVAVLVAAVLCSTVGFAIAGGFSKTPDPAPRPAVLAGHPFTREFDPSELAGSGWNSPRNQPGGCVANPAQVKLNSSGNVELDTNGQDGNCTSIQSPQTYPTTAGYVYEADIYFSSFKDWPSFWMYGNHWPFEGEIDAAEANRNANYVTWHYGPCDSSAASSQLSTNPFSYDCKSDLTPTPGVPNLTPGWHVVDIAFDDTGLDVYYDGKLYVTVPETATSTSSNSNDPMWIVFSTGSCSESSKGGNTCAPGADGVSGNLQVRYLRIFS